MSTAHVEKLARHPVRLLGGEEMVSMDDRFWSVADQLVADNEITIDRPRGSRHPRWPDVAYPLDYGYLTGTRAMDGGGIDVWCGSLPERRVTGAIVTLDLLKRDAEVNLLIGCTDVEAAMAFAAQNDGAQAGLLVRRTASGA